MSGTASFTIVKEYYKNGNKTSSVNLCCLHRLYDGNLFGHGQELFNFLKYIKIVNGIGKDTQNIANGMDCLAAQLVARFKRSPGDFYLLNSDTDTSGESYVYTIYNKPNSSKLYIEIKACDKVIYDGLISKLNVKKFKTG